MDAESWNWVNCKVFVKGRGYKTGGVNGMRRRGTIESLLEGGDIQRRIYSQVFLKTIQANTNLE